MEQKCICKQTHTVYFIYQSMYTVYKATVMQTNCAQKNEGKIYFFSFAGRYAMYKGNSENIIKPMACKQFVLSA